MLGKEPEAHALLERALKDALSDDFLLPFVENYHYLKRLLENGMGQYKTFIRRIVQLGKEYELRQRHLYEQTTRPAAFAVLTEREYEILGLMKERLSNREIAERLFLSEGSIKQYINQIYSKLNIDGDTRTKRQQILSMLNANP